jgi:serine/threonine-protein kinase
MDASIKYYPELLKQYKVDVSQSLDPANYGSVYKGIDDSGTAIAVKTIEIHPNYDLGLYANRFKNAQKIQHPNLLPYQQFFEFRDTMITQVLKMPYRPMGDLNKQLDLAGSTKKLIVDQVIDALGYLHDHEIVWQNLSSKHILMQFMYGNHIPQLINYGNKMPIPLPYFSEYEYLAPEQFDPQYRPDIRTDIWALSVLIYKLWTGRMPFGQKTTTLPNTKIKARITGDWAPGLFAQIPEPYKTIAEKGLNRKKDSRWNNCGEIIAVIKNYKPIKEKKDVVLATEDLSDQRMVRRVPNRPINWLLVVVLLMMAALLGYWVNHL